MRMTKNWSGQCNQCGINLIEQFEMLIELRICSMDGTYLCSITARRYICSQCHRQTIVLRNCTDAEWKISRWDSNPAGFASYREIYIEWLLYNRKAFQIGNDYGIGTAGTMENQLTNILAYILLVFSSRSSEWMTVLYLCIPIYHSQMIISYNRVSIAGNILAISASKDQCGVIGL